METDDDRVAFFNDKSDMMVLRHGTKNGVRLYTIYINITYQNSYIQIRLSISNTSVHKV